MSTSQQLNTLLDGLASLLLLPVSLSNLPSEDIEQTAHLLGRLEWATKTIHNSRTPVNVLNEDILYNIFSIIIFLNPDHGMKSILSISQVCRRWREIALRCPRLWGFVDIFKPVLSDIFLRRAADCPLYLRGNFPGRREWPELEASFTPVSQLLRCLRNLRSTHIKGITMVSCLDGDHDIPLNFLMDIFQKQYPLKLEYLHLDLPNFHGESPLEKLLHPEGSPAVLILKGVYLTSEAVKNLRVLILVNPCIALSLEQLLRVLTDSPYIEELVLEGIENWSLRRNETIMQQETTSISQFRLESLWRFEFSFSDSEALEYLTKLLGIIAMPRLSRIRMNYIRGTLEGKQPFDAFELLPPLYLPLLQKSAVLSITSPLELRMNEFATCQFSAGDDESSHPDPNTKYYQIRPGMNALLSCFCSPDTNSNLLKRIAQFRNVRKLELTLDAAAYLSSIGRSVNLAAWMPNIEVVDLMAYLSPHRIHQLANWGSQALNLLLPPDTRFPLQRLILRGLDLSNQFPKLMRIIRQTGLRTLDICGCINVQYSDLEPIKASDIQVFWSLQMTAKEKRERWGNWFWHLEAKVNIIDRDLEFS
ncbi:hypothetical protein M422DRAFT_45476 [Sphaerobolus stellatus SS14]|uniref:F-box domain-containing protein n=1 Tax=Sphaerobolus stellatus (strain SS14) TaxID=990650 RepID=A0A0C9W4T6_SPHS4|nr:hypothetical protein M422DRAFT_45476 [Sphaerobolus stellatus SS14]